MPVTAAGGISRRPSLHNPIPPPTPPEPYSDSRFHGPPGPSRYIRFPGIASHGGGAIAKSEDGQRCVVAGRESLRVLRMSEPGTVTTSEHKSLVGRGGYRIDASRNLWAGSGLKLDSSSTDVVWCHGTYGSKILTSARNGELIMWDLNKSGPSKYERRIKEHARAIHQIAYSPSLQYLFVTGSADGYIRVWDLRDMRAAITQIRHPASVRSVVLSPVSWQPLQAVTALDNGNIYMWDLQMGQRGQLHRIPLAHSGPILTLDWTLPSTYTASSQVRIAGPAPASQSTTWYNNVGAGLFDDIGGTLSSGSAGAAEGETTGMGWLASGGMDRCVKVWNLTTPPGDAHISRIPAYTLHTSYPVRRVRWRPGYECELAVASSIDFDIGHKSSASASASAQDLTADLGVAGSPHVERTEAEEPLSAGEDEKIARATSSRTIGDPVEIWDVRRGYVAKWALRGSAVEGGVTDITFADSHTLWVQHFSGAFSQLDLRASSRPLDAMPRAAIAWDPCGSVMFVSGKSRKWEIPYDDVSPDKKNTAQRKVKALGDPVYTPTTQTLGLVAGHGLMEDIETFVKLAQGYVFEGSEKTVLCSRNAEVATAAGKFSAVQVWQLLMSLLADLLPPSEAPTATPTPSLSPLPFVSPRLPHANTAPASIPTVSHPSNIPVPPPHPVRSLSESVHGTPSGRSSPDSKPSTPLRAEDRSRTHSAAPSLSISSSGTGYLSPPRNTPVSSTTTSPHRPHSPLPPVSSSMISPASFRRSSAAQGIPMSLNVSSSSARPRLGSSSYRRPSFTMSGVHSITESPSDVRSQSHNSLRHVGDGALDDSDSEGSGDEGTSSMSMSMSVSTLPTAVQEEDELDSDEERDVIARASSSRRSSVYRSTVSPYLYPRGSVQPSPLSQVAGQHTWTEDEKEEEDSPSPASTDSESESDDHFVSRVSASASVSRGGSTGGGSRSRRSSVKSARSKARSRSSTVASLAASVELPATPPSKGRLVKQESQSSIRTVTATPTPTSIHTPGIGQHESPSRDFGSASAIQSAQVVSASRLESGSIRSSSFYSQSRSRSEGQNGEGGGEPERRNTDSTIARAARVARRENVKSAESRLREAGWAALRETLEVFADEGDIQMCAMLALIAPEELRISERRVLRFLESYIELLARLRLHAIAACVRKYATVDDIRNTTSMETTIYTCCGRCRKPLLHPVARPTHSARPSGSYAFCATCKKSTTRCSICHLPVRALLFQCPVCLHGGHRNCYQQYYLRRPLQELPSLPAPAATAKAPETHRSTPTTPESKFRGRAISRSVDGDGSDDGVSSRDGEDGRFGFRGPDSNVIDTKNTLLGHPCAAGCGHYCWAANEALPYSPDQLQLG